MKVAELTIDNKTLKLPIITGTENEQGIDITKLRSETNHITYDPSYANTGSCASNITYINGEDGILRYRGYPIEQLAENASFVEVIYLLLHGNLPKENQCHLCERPLRFCNLVFCKPTWQIHFDLSMCHTDEKLFWKSN